MTIKQYQPPKMVTIVAAENEPEINFETGSITWDNKLTESEIQAMKMEMGVKYPNLIAWNSIIQRRKAGMKRSDIIKQLSRTDGCAKVSIKRVLAAWNKINGIKEEFRYRGKS